MDQTRITILLALTLIVSIAGGGAALAWTIPPQNPQPPVDAPVVVRLYVEDRSHLEAVAGALDIWETHPAEKYAVAAVTPAQYQWLAGLGYRLEIDAAKTALLAPTAALDPRFYYFDDFYSNSNGLYVLDFLQGVQAAYPDLTALYDIGDAWMAGQPGEHDRDIWVLRITNEHPAYGPIADKPVFFLFAGIHAREVAVPELAIRYVKYLTEGYDGEGGYGVDPDVTWLVNHNVAYVLVMQNPDGHWQNEQNTGNYRRKNMDSDDGCTYPISWGVDLNRNHSFLWSCCNGSSGDPCSETYRGPSQASEPETQAFQNYFGTVVRDQNGPNGDNEPPLAAPITTTGIFISLHSYSDLVLWPWGFDNYGNPPNYAQLTTIGRKFAYYNGYDPSATIWYDVDGATDDWTYGKFGIPSYTFEVGPSGGSCGDFFPAYGCLDGIDGMPRDFWAENKPAFLYAHKIARTPYVTAYGPDTGSVAVSAGEIFQGLPVTLTAIIADHRYSGDPLQPVVAAEYFVDAPGEDGAGAPMDPTDGAWGGLDETASAAVGTLSLSPGRHYILVHGQNDDGNWGPFTATFLTVTTTPEQTLAPNPLIRQMIDQVDQTTLYSMTGELSGEWAAIIGGSPYTIANRNTYGGAPIQHAAQYVYEHLAAAGLSPSYYQWNASTNPNVIGTLTGLRRPDDILLITGHLDDMPTGPIAPGADDNASGAVSVLVAAQILGQYRWDCTLRFVTFTGEEQGLLGSNAYAQRAYNDGDNILGVLNLDMLAYNSTTYPAPVMELHTRPGNAGDLSIAALFYNVVDAYALDLAPEIVQDGETRSDHSSFWDRGYPAILAIEDFQDFTPYYHQVTDRLSTLDMDYYTEFVRAAVGTFAHMGCLTQGALDGFVTDQSTGLPLTATVVASGSQLPFTTTSNASGYYTTTLAVDAYTVTAQAALYGYYPAVVTGVVVLPDTVTHQNLTLAPYPDYVISGTITDAVTGAPLAATVATVVCPEGDCHANTYAAVASDPATGYYSATLISGTYVLRVQAAGYRSITRTVRADHRQTQNFALAPSLPSPGFSSSSPDLVGATTTFTNTTTGVGPLTYTWDLGDGSWQVQPPDPGTGTSLLSIVHVYTRTGQYTVWLTATNASGAAAVSGTVEITGTPPTARFSYALPVIMGTVVVFTNTTVPGQPAETSYLWSLGDGVGYSTAASLVYTYATTGTYTVWLTATNLAGSDVYHRFVFVGPHEDVYLPMVLRGGL